MISRWKVDLVIKVRIVGIVEDKEPASLCVRKGLTRFVDSFSEVAK